MQEKDSIALLATRDRKNCETAQKGFVGARCQYINPVSELQCEMKIYMLTGDAKSKY
jgi:hypothetical protein